MHMPYDASPSKDAPRNWGASSVSFITRLNRIAAVLTLLFLGTPSAYAHKVNMFAYVEGSKVMMEGYFADGNKPVDCEVIVTNPDKKVLIKGRTDQEGKFSFDVPEITDLRIALNAGMGHRAEFIISRDELAGVKATGAAVTSPTGDADADSTSIVAAAKRETQDEGASISAASVGEDAVRKAVVEANLPLVRAIDELKEGAKFGNIVGGIGVIFGMVGVFFYLKARKMLAQSSGRASAAK